MRMKKTFSIVILLLLCVFGAQGQVQDSVNVQDYDITLDLSDGAPFHGETVVTLQLLRPCSSISLDFIGTVDSLRVNGSTQAVTQSSSQTFSLSTAGIAAGQPFTVHVWYTCTGYVESGGWGGMHFDQDMSYNLGVGFDANPHVMGRAFFPCRDNFTDKATYTFRVKTRAGWTAECGGMLQSRVLNADNTENSVWRIEQPTPTYLVSVSQAAWKRIYDSIESVYGTYPVTYGYLYPDSTTVRRVFAELDSVVPMYERCFGPYRWGRIGYIATNRGSMEHVNNIGLAYQAMSTMAESGQATIAHELGHAWFGNLVTCETAKDMWINEGGASFASEVAMEGVNGRTWSDDYYQRKLESVLRTTHITDGGYYALTPISHALTYGSTVYEKGWMVWHSLRGYLGEEVFYNALQRLMNSCAFGNIDSYRLRDSLSLYTGVDLTDFFDFHVFSPGFVDYRASYSANGQEVTLNMRQQGVATNARARGNRVPVTFFSTDGGSHKVWTAFDGEDTTVTLTLPFDPVYCVLDYDQEISDAATVSILSLEGDNLSQTANVCHVKGRSTRPATVNVEHHWGKPYGTMPANVIRTANRYWVLRGQWGLEDEVKMNFRFVRTGSNTSKYANLDRGFYARTASRDSLALLYRGGEADEWHVVSWTKSGSANEGFLDGENLLPGEYTLAIVDSTLSGIGEVEGSKWGIEMFPNPLRRGEPLTVKTGSTAPYTVSIFDEEGRQVWLKNGCSDGQKLSPALGKGTYLVRIENNFISLQSKLIQL